MQQATLFTWCVRALLQLKRVSKVVVKNILVLESARKKRRVGSQVFWRNYCATFLTKNLVVVLRLEGENLIKTGHYIAKVQICCPFGHL